MKQIKKGIYMQTQPQILELVLRIIYNLSHPLNEFDSALKSLLKEEIHCKRGAIHASELGILNLRNFDDNKKGQEKYEKVKL